MEKAPEMLNFRSLSLEVPKRFWQGNKNIGEHAMNDTKTCMYICIQFFVDIFQSVEYDFAQTKSMRRLFVGLIR